MSTGDRQPVEVVDAAKGNAATSEEKVLTPDNGVIATKDHVGPLATGSDTDEPLRGPNGEEYPSKRDLETLRRVQGHISPIIYTIAFIELCERFAYYGTTAVCTTLPLQSAPKFKHMLTNK